jgi:uncharacterized protein with GYD domain
MDFDRIACSIARAVQLHFAAIDFNVNAPSSRGARRRIKQTEDAMPKYLLEAHYSTEGAKGLAKEGGTGRRAAVAKMAESVGGKLESFYFAFGGVDAFVIVDLPDNVTAAAVTLAASQSGRRASRPLSS